MAVTSLSVLAVGYVSLDSPKDESQMVLLNPSVKDLVALCSPAAVAAFQGNDAEWSAIEEELMTHLPLDYKQLVITYGAGCFSAYGNELCLLNPFFPSDNLVTSARTLKANYGPLNPPFKMYPHSPGLLPCGYTNDADMVFWLTCSNPDQWPIVLWSNDALHFEKHNLTLTALIVRWLNGEFASEILRNGKTPSEIPEFVPVVHCNGPQKLDHLIR